jgi:dihydrofolate synthase/folylpolyglutamate synthase
LDEYFPRKTIHVVLGVSADKNLVGLVDPMGPRLGRVVATQSLHPRAMPADKLSSELRVLGVNARPEQSPRKAMEKVLRETSADDVVLVWGSVFLVEEVREFQHLRLT